ncbi:dTMP kinase [uncultured Parolsenella sp.]|uniref:dTMP kinase n=1 Tax=uncultured Parolsenella sp. TaxID=2083008 RepID=UPI0027DABAB4|nr:dTMP kinase [uncultured Parolsenella sp.]
MPSARGTFITLEGVDGSGKSTQASLLVERLRQEGREVVALREPGGTPISEKIRALLLDPENAEMADECELLLYEASRAQLVREVIEPALLRGDIVVCDRFYDSTHAYQHGGRGLSDALVSRANELGCCGLSPDVTLVLDIDPAAALARATAQGADRLEAEGLAFQQRVRKDYLALAKADPARVCVIDAAGDPELVAGRIDAALARAGVSAGEVSHG